MKTLHLLIDGNIGGTERLCKDYTQYSQNENIALFLWGNGPLGDELKNNGIDVICLNNSSKKIYRTLRDVLRICKEKEINAVIAHYPGILSQLCLLAIKSIIPKIFTVAYAHSNAINMCRANEKKGLWLRKLILKKSLLKADKVIAISKSVKQSLIDVFKTPNDKITIIYNGVDINRFTSKKHKLNKLIEVIYVGRLIKDKGVQVILEGLSLLPKDANYVFKIVGYGPFRGELENLTKQYNLQDKVEFLGIRRDVPKLLSQSDIFVHLPVWEEGFGITIVEAMAAGLVCVCAKSGAISEIIHDGKNGFLVEKENSKKFSQRIDGIIKNIDTDKIDIIRKTAVEDAGQYSIEKFVDSLDAILIRK